VIRVSRKVEYGLIALKHMSHRQSELVSAKELSHAYGLSPALTAKILQAMTQYGLLASEQGTRGGYRLRRDLGSISYLDLQNAILGNTAHPDAGSRHRECELFDRCVVIAPVQSLEERIRELLATTSVAELFQGRDDTECCREPRVPQPSREVHSE
jgi:Rrf2 family protein